VICFFSIQGIKRREREFFRATSFSFLPLKPQEIK